jgi:hypothetical protein
VKLQARPKSTIFLKPWVQGGNRARNGYFNAGQGVEIREDPGKSEASKNW